MIKKLSHLIILSFSVLTFNPHITEGSDWIRIDGNTDIKLEQYLFDIESVKQKGSVVSFWAKRVYSNNTYDLVRFSFNCKENEFKGLDKITYTKNGNSPVTHSLSHKWEGVPPDSYLDTLKGIVCKGNKPRPINEIEDVRGYREFQIEQKKKAQ